MGVLTCEHQAIAFLHQTSQYQADAVHFAITLTYYGLMRIPSRAMTSDVDLREFPTLAPAFLFSR